MAQKSAGGNPGGLANKGGDPGAQGGRGGGGKGGTGGSTGGKPKAAASDFAWPHLGPPITHCRLEPSEVCSR